MLVLLVSLAFAMTFAGGLIPAGVVTRVGMRRLFAVRAGILLAVAFTELLPEGLALHRSLAGWTALAAFGLLYALGSLAMLDSCPEYLQECRVHYLGAAALLALSLHSFLDGFNLAVSFGAGQAAGLAVGTAVVLHKIADGFTLTSLLRQSGLSSGRTWGILAFVASATPLGCALSSLGMADLPRPVTASLMGFAAGSFIHIGATDVLPLVHRREDRASIAAFVLALGGVSLLHLLHGHG
ncbi:MAG: ZIP family metal transporter [Elusimicrobiota bacterium]|jgi:ZIP family zinc transporter/zinc and cadmium transporter